MFVYPSENPCSSLKNYWCETNRICLVVAKWLLVFTHAISLHLPNLYQSSAGCCRLVHLSIALVSVALEKTTKKSYFHPPLIL
jgi:hypothetical protein